MVGSTTAAGIGLPCYNAPSSSTVDAHFVADGALSDKPARALPRIHDGSRIGGVPSSAAGFQAVIQAIFKMFKIIITAAVVALLSACSSMSGGGMSGTQGMSNSANMGQGSGPVGSSGGGPN